MTGFTISHGQIVQAEGLSQEEMHDLQDTVTVLAEMDTEEGEDSTNA